MATAYEIDSRAIALSQDYMIVKPPDTYEWPIWTEPSMDHLEGDIIPKGEPVWVVLDSQRRAVRYMGWNVNLRWLVPVDPNHLFTIP